MNKKLSGLELLDKFYRLSRQHPSFEEGEKLRKMGVLTNQGSFLTEDEKTFLIEANKIYSQYTTIAILEQDGIFLSKKVGKGKKTKEEFKELNELRNEYAIFANKSEKEMQDIFQEYIEKADALRIIAFNNWSEKLYKIE